MRRKNSTIKIVKMCYEYPFKVCFLSTRESSQTDKVLCELLWIKALLMKIQLCICSTLQDVGTVHEAITPRKQNTSKTG